MNKSSAAVSAGKQCCDEYSVYVFHKMIPETQKEPVNWELKFLSADMSDALTHAAALYNTRKYYKVEVKKKAYHDKTDTYRDETLKTYDESISPGKKEIKKKLIVISAALASAFIAMAFVI